MKLDKNSRRVVHAIERNGGSATTTVIRQETGMDNSSVRYRYRKLKDMGLISTQKDPSETPDGVAPMTVATLTDKARREIQEGLTVEAKQVEADLTPQDNADRLDDLADAINVLRAHLDIYRTYITEYEETPSEKEIIEKARERYQTRYDS